MKRKAKKTTKGDTQPQQANAAILSAVRSVGATEAKSYVKVNTDSKGAITTVVSTPISGGREFAKNLLGLKPMTVVLSWAPAASTGTANTAYNTQVQLDPTAASEWSSWASLFDECRIRSISTRSYFGWSATTFAPATMTCAVVAFDPALATALTSIEQGMQHTRMAGPILVNSSAAAQTVGSSMLQVTRLGGLEVKSGPLAKGALPMNNSGTLTTAPVQGDWFPTNTSGAIIGWLKPYVEALGANISATFRTFIWFNAEFRMRG
jgi:hypothetical protein